MSLVARDNPVGTLLMQELLEQPLTQLQRSLTQMQQSLTQLQQVADALAASQRLQQQQLTELQGMAATAEKHAHLQTRTQLMDSFLSHSAFNARQFKKRVPYGCEDEEKIISRYAMLDMVLEVYDAHVAGRANAFWAERYALVEYPWDLEEPLGSSADPNRAAFAALFAEQVYRFLGLLVTTSWVGREYFEVTLPGGKVRDRI